MFQSKDVLNLQEGERIEGIIRRHYSTLWPRLLLAGAFIILPFFFLFALLSLGLIGLLLVVFSVALGIFLALKALIVWDARVLLLTNRRLIHVDQRGIWSRKVQEAPLWNIRSVECEQTGLLDRICRTATVVINTDGTSGTIQFSALPRFRQFQEKLGGFSGDGVRRPSSNDIG
jgi:uncharacterized membrane protein YdbT with pleckstrin-like domain